MAGDSALLENEVKKLKRKLEQQTADLQLAAEIGKQLLDGNNDLNNQMDNMAKEHSAKVEVCTVVVTCATITSCVQIKKSKLLGLLIAPHDFTENLAYHKPIISI